MRASRNDWRFHGHGCCCRRHRMSQAVDTSARTTSIWLRTAPAPDIPALETDTVADDMHWEFERVDGYLFLAPGDKPSLLDEELEAAHRAGLVGVERVPRAPLAAFDTGPALRFPRQAQFHPLRYLDGLAVAIRRM